MPDTSTFPDGTTRRNLDTEQFTRLQDDFAQAQVRQFAELWYTGENGSSFAILVNGEQAWLMYLEDREDSGVHSYNPAYTGAEDALLKFELNNGQQDEYPASWTLRIADALLAAEYFLQEEAKAPWIKWIEA